MIELIFDNIRKPINVGAVVRLACAAGSKVYFTGNSIDYKTRKALLAAVGYEDQVDLTYENDFRKLVGRLKAEGKTIVGTSPRAQQLYTEVNFTDPVVLVFGNEATGLSQENMALLDHVVSIPMPGGVESLNLVTSAAILLYEGLRQRKFT